MVVVRQLLQVPTFKVLAAEEARRRRVQMLLAQLVVAIPEARAAAALR